MFDQHARHWNIGSVISSNTLLVLWLLQYRVFDNQGEVYQRQEGNLARPRHAQKDWLKRKGQPTSRQVVSFCPHAWTCLLHFAIFIGGIKFPLEGEIVDGQHDCLPDN